MLQLFSDCGTVRRFIGFNQGVRFLIAAMFLILTSPTLAEYPVRMLPTSDANSFFFLLMFNTLLFYFIKLYIINIYHGITGEHFQNK